MNFSANITHLDFSNASIDGDQSIIQIEEGCLIITLKNLNLNFTFDYEYISEPAIFVDVGNTMFML